jgi:hypothetical protein
MTNISSYEARWNASHISVATRAVASLLSPSDVAARWNGASEQIGGVAVASNAAETARGTGAAAETWKGIDAAATVPETVTETDVASDEGADIPLGIRGTASAWVPVMARRKQIDISFLSRSQGSHAETPLARLGTSSFPPSAPTNPSLSVAAPSSRHSRELLHRKTRWLQRRR